MSWSIDARIPVSLLPGPAALAEALAHGKPAAVLGAEGAAQPSGGVALATFPTDAVGHAAACACCQGRSPAAQALDRLFQGRARGTSPWFDRVLVLETDGAGEAVRAALRDDSMASARFRLA